MLNLSHDVAQQRAAMLEVHHYDIALDLSGAPSEQPTFSARTEISFVVRQPGTTVIDLVAAAIDSAELDTVALDTSGYSPQAGLSLPDLQPGEHRLVIESQMEYSRTGQGLHRFVDPVDLETYIYTQCETADAQRIFACFDQPDLKATWTLTVTVPQHWKVISNADFSEADTSPTPAARTWTMHAPWPLSTYLFAVCAGPYVHFGDQWSGSLTHHPETPADQPTELSVPLGIYARASLAEHVDAPRLFQETKQGFDFYHEHFGMGYPFGKYDQIFVPEFNAGAMENAGCVTIRDEYIFTSPATFYRYEVRASTILHELAHMWFGDMVTMKWWDDLWLNESFAAWSEVISQAEATEYRDAWVTFTAVSKSWAYQQDQLPSTHPVSTDASDIETVEQNFDGITYAKGAALLRQLVAYVGREEFLAGVRRHFAAHAWSNATFADLLGHLEAASGRDLSFWSAQWLSGTGVGTLSAEFQIEDGRYTSFELVQSGTEPRTHRVAVGLYRDGQRYHRVELDISAERTPVTELIGVPAAQLVLPNDDDLSYTLVDLDDDSLQWVLAHGAHLADPMARALCWSATWEMTRAGRMRARDYVQLVAGALEHETQLAVLEKIIAQAVVAQSQYADPQWAAQSTVLADALVAAAADPQPERAIIAAQAATRLALSPASREFIETVLASSTDQNLRWLALAAYSADAPAGPADPSLAEQIAAEEARDPSATGRQGAIRARAALPDPSTKRAVIDQAIAGTLGNRDLESSLLGLRAPHSAAVLAEVTSVAEYLEVAPLIWEQQTSEMAVSTLTGLFPSWAAESGQGPQVIAAVAEFLERDGLPAGMRRVLSEENDRLARQLRNRQYDAS